MQPKRRESHGVDPGPVLQAAYSASGGYRVLGVGFRVRGLGFRFGVWGLGIRV